MLGFSITPSCGCLQDAQPALLPSALSTKSALGNYAHAGQYSACTYPTPTDAPLPLRDGSRTAWGQRGSLFLYCNGLSPNTLRLSLGAPTTTLTQGALTRRIVVMEVRGIDSWVEHGFFLLL